MSIPLLPLSGAALGTFAWQAFRELPPGQFLRELWHGTSSAAEAAPPGNPPPAPPSLDELVSGLREILGKAGVDLSQPLVLGVDSRGDVTVSGMHLDRDTIEEVLAQHPEWRAQMGAYAAAAKREQETGADLRGSTFAEFRLHVDADRAATYFE
ncbi:MAG: hypothetical protein AB7F89_02135 [Pirellulaceae bacterium]